MKKRSLKFVICCLPLLASLASCNKPIDSFVKTALPYGTMEFEGEEVGGMSHLVKMSYSELSAKVQEQKNFLLIVHNYDELCSCWHDFHDNILVPYIKEYKLLWYVIDYRDMQNQTNTFGLQLLSNHETLAIFNKGAITYQKTNANQQEEFVYKLSAFKEWMDARIYYPRVFLLDKDQLDAKYENHGEFTVYFLRLSCGDCSYLETSFILDYVKDNQNMSPLYAIDCDAEGIRKYNGASAKDPAKYPDATDDEKQAFKQYNKFKEDYGLIASEDNPAGWDADHSFPCLFHINSEANGKKKGDVIDSAAIFYNEGMNYATGEITNSYFTEERLQLECLSYLKDSSIEKKVLKGLFVEPYDEAKWGNLRSKYRHEVTAPLINPIVKAFFDYNVGNNN
ncbi:MAG: hypothetical protein SPL00_04530 [Bacilli bacterium]|nr:hypothetical protein [Bacilli bacterium]